MKYSFQNEIALAEKIATAKPGDFPYTLFLGAGASVSSGVSSTFGLIKRWKQLLYKEQKGIQHKEIIDDNDFKKWQNDEEGGYTTWLKEKLAVHGGTEYSILFGYFFQTIKERQLFIEKELEEKKPTFGYLFLSGLIKEKRFNRVLTTNFDDLLNDALVKFYDERPIVCAFDSAVSGIRVASLRPKIIKLHGDFLYDNIRNIKQELKTLEANMEEKMCEMCKDAGLIVVGYSGNDESIMAPIRELIRKKEYLNFGLHWCIKKEEDEEIKIPEKLEDLRRNYEDRIYLYTIKDFDYLMEVLYRTCGCNLPNDFIDPSAYNMPINFHRWVNNSSTVRSTSYMTDILSLIIKSSESKKDTPIVKLLNAGNIYNLAENIRQEGKYEEAKTKFDECLSIINELLKNESISPEDVLTLYKQKCGVLLAKAQISFKIDKDNQWKKFLISSINSAQDGIDYFKQKGENSFKDSIKRILFYNACCAYSIMAEYTENLTDEIKNIVLNYLKEIQKIDYEGNEINDLIKDTDFQFFANNCCDIIQREIKE